MAIPSETLPPIALKAIGLKKDYGNRAAVRGVDLMVRKGQIVGLLGPNGSGKTTTFYLLAGILRPSSGQVWLGEQEVTSLPLEARAQRGLTYLPQEPSIFRGLSVRNNLAVIAETLPLSNSARKERIQQALQKMNLGAVAPQMAYSLSGGERRRLEIARALLIEPQVILLDEPFSGVDPISVGQVQQLILGLKAQGLSVLITDHNVRETLRIVDHAYLLYEGEILSQGSRQHLIEDPQSRKLYLGEDLTGLN